VITEETIQKLNDMKLHAMAKVLREILATAPGNGLSFEEKVGLIVDREWTDRDNRRLSWRLKEAKLGTGRACLEDVTIDASRGIDKSAIRDLATCAWAKAKQNVVIIGASLVASLRSSAQVLRNARPSPSGIGAQVERNTHVGRLGPRPRLPGLLHHTDRGSPTQATTTGPLSHVEASSRA
jgi:IstB-like ATP binding protein